MATKPLRLSLGYRVLPVACCLLSFLSACSEGNPTEQPLVRRPVLSIVQTASRGIEVRIAGPTGLRALQAKLGWDPAALRVLKVEPGRESKRLDRVFFNDPAKASGSLIFGLTDTRQVQLPARGALITLLIATVDASQASATLRVEEALGAEEGGTQVAIDPVSAEVKLR